MFRNDTAPPRMNAAPAVEWQQSQSLISYPEALAAMEARVAALQTGQANELVWLLEHPPLYTGGTSAKASDLISAPFPVYDTGRGGQYTYHGPGQRVGYVMLDLKRRAAPGEPDLRRYVQQLEAWIIATLAEFGITGELREGRIGVWVVGKDGREAKIAALGIRVKQWVTYHGIALNVSPDLSHYAGIVPCGIKEYGVTSLKAMGVDVSMAEVDAALQRQFAKIFG
jgi:lipoyl(octanoyl) transferase